MKTPSDKISAGELLRQLGNFQNTGLIGLSTVAAAAMVATGEALPGLYGTSQSALTTQLKGLLGRRAHIPAAKARELAKKLDMSMDRLMIELIPVARGFARAPISGFRVGVVGKGRKGDLYFGYNIEFPGVPLNQTVHGEQAAVSIALMKGETSMEAVALIDAPSGECRQFLNELPRGGNLRILMHSRRPMRLSTLLPHSFGPAELGEKAALLHSRPWDLELATKDELSAAALEAARRSYAPYSRSPSGVALSTGTRIYAGGCAENAAFNPSLSPLQAALVHLVADGGDYADIQRAVLVEREGARAAQEGSTRMLLEAIAPQARLKVLKAR
ncbi:MAG: cytidine deaminase [Candidatus Eremiobacterota bacterium]